MVSWLIIAGIIAFILFAVWLGSGSKKNDSQSSRWNGGWFGP